MILGETVANIASLVDNVTSIGQSTVQSASFSEKLTALVSPPDKQATKKRRATGTKKIPVVCLPPNTTSHFGLIKKLPELQKMGYGNYRDLVC